MGIYLVTFSAETIEGLGDKPSLIYRKVECPNFLPVEDHAHENCPEGYFLWSIEKLYHDGAEEMYGKTDFVLEGRW